MRTISRSKSTVVVRVSCAFEGVISHKRHRRHRSILSLLCLLWLILFCWCDDIERKRKGVNLVVPAELRPGAIMAGLRHQTLKRHIRTAAKRLQICSGRYRELRRPTVVVGFGQDIERMRVNVIDHILAHDQRVPERTKISLQIGHRPSCCRILQMKVQMPVLADYKRRRIVVERGCNVVYSFGKDCIRHQMRAIHLEIANVPGGDQRSCNELRSPAARHEIGEDLVIAGFRKGDVDRPGAIRLLLRMNMLEILHILADDEKMVLAFVYDLEFLDRLVTAWMKNAKQQLCLLTRF